METAATQEHTPTESPVEETTVVSETQTTEIPTPEAEADVTTPVEGEGAEATEPTAEAAPAVTDESTDEPAPEASAPEAADDATAEESEAEEEAHPMEALLEESLTLKHFRRGQMVEGIIIAKTDSEIIIDIGGKSEGIVPAQDLSRLSEEFLNSLNVGDEVVAYVLQPEGREGHAVLSLSRAQAEYDWRRVDTWRQEGTTIEAPVTEVNRGGVVVQVGQLRGFVPASHLERRGRTEQGGSPEERFADLKGQVLKLKVLEVDRRRKRLILSEKEAMREERERERERLLNELREGEVRRGRVTSITNFGAFVDLGGIDGLIHISELAWRRVNHPSEVVQVGDEVEVYVLSVDREKGRVGLSLRRLQPKPWETVLERYAIGQVVEGVVTKVMPFDTFVRLEDGIEGLVHISELADHFVSHPHEVVKEGDTVRVRILRIDPEAKRMGLSIKQASEDAYVEVDWDIADEEELAEDTGAWEGLSEVTPEAEAPAAEAETAESPHTPQGEESAPAEDAASENDVAPEPSSG